MKEIWKKIEGFDKYEVSNFGNVRHIKNGNLKIQYNLFGYAQVLIYKNGKAKSIRVNRAVMKAFRPIENCEEMEVNHKNYNRGDNRIENLEWTTRKENCKHRNNHLEYYNSEACVDSEGRIFKSYREAGRFHGISPNTVKNDVLGKTKRKLGGRSTFSKIK